MSLSQRSLGEGGPDTVTTAAAMAEHADYADLQAACAIVDDVVTYVNDECGDAAQRNRLDGIHQKLLKDLSEVGRRPRATRARPAARIARAC